MKMQREIEVSISENKRIRKLIHYGLVIAIFASPWTLLLCRSCDIGHKFADVIDANGKWISQQVLMLRVGGVANITDKPYSLTPIFDISNFLVFSGRPVHGHQLRLNQLVGRR